MHDLSDPVTVHVNTAEAILRRGIRSHANLPVITNLVEFNYIENKTLETQLTEKGQEINGYIEKHNIQIRGQPGAPSAGKDKEEKEEEESKSSGVLVASKS